MSWPATSTSYLIGHLPDYLRHTGTFRSFRFVTATTTISPSCSVSASLPAPGRYSGLLLLGRASRRFPYARLAVRHGREFKKFFEVGLATSLPSLSNSRREVSSIQRLYLVRRRRRLGDAMQSRPYVRLSHVLDRIHDAFCRPRSPVPSLGWRCF